MTAIKRAINILGGQSAAARTLGLSGYQVAQQWITQGRVPADYCPRIEVLTGVRCEELNDRVEWGFIRGTAPTALDLLKTLEASHPTKGSPMTTNSIAAPLEESPGIYARRRAQLRLLVDQRTAGNIAAFADQFGYSRSRVSQFLSESYNEGRSIGERAARALEEVAGLSIGWLDAGAPIATSTSTTDQAAQLRAAIAETRAVFVFESQRIVGWALDYLMVVMRAGATAYQVDKLRELAMQREVILAGGANASIAKETHTGAGAEPVAGAADMLAGLKRFVADVNQKRAAPAPSTIVSNLVVNIDTSAIDVALDKVAELRAALASVVSVQGDRLVLS